MGEIEIWVVGKHLGRDSAWELNGVFTDKELAEKAILGPSYFIGKIPLNTAFTDSSVEWDVEYPLG